MPTKLDLIGKTFGMLTVLRREPPGSPQPRKWLCLCSCGNTCKKVSHQLTSGAATHCGCVPSYIDMTGKRFGRLVVLRYYESSKKQAQWECVCDCGKTTVVLGTHLRNGNTRSCGCLMMDTSRRSKNKTHGASSSPEYHAWSQAKARCSDVNHKAWKNYGGRGITMCARWMTTPGGFEAFLSDMGKRPTPSHSLDRIDNDRGYSPENCRWTSLKDQAKNRRPRKRTPEGRFV